MPPLPNAAENRNPETNESGGAKAALEVVVGPNFASKIASEFFLPGWVAVSPGKYPRKVTLAKHQNEAAELSTGFPSGNVRTPHCSLGPCARGVASRVARQYGHKALDYTTIHCFKLGGNLRPFVLELS